MRIFRSPFHYGYSPIHPAGFPVAGYRVPAGAQPYMPQRDIFDWPRTLKHLTFFALATALAGFGRDGTRTETLPPQIIVVAISIVFLRTLLNSIREWFRSRRIAGCERAERREREWHQRLS